MLNATRALLKRNLHMYPAPPVRRMYKRRMSPSRMNPYANYFWRHTMNESYERTSFWTSDFRHKYLVKTGTDYQGVIPASPTAGTYQRFRGFDTRHVLAGHPLPTRESRQLPVIPLTPRVVYEHRNEQRIDFARQTKRDRAKIIEMRDREFHEWYSKLQRVRGKWCRENEIASRGVYGPAVDSAEIWG